MQMPLPKGLDASRIIDAIDPAKDVDGLHPTNAGLLLVGRPGLRACTPSGCMRLLAEAELRPGGQESPSSSGAAFSSVSPWRCSSSRRMPP